MSQRLIAEISPLADLHCLETQDVKEPLIVAWETYIELQEKNVLHTFTARKDGELVGYSFYKVICHPHHLQPPVMMAVMDRCYLIPSCRGVGRGGAFIRFTEDCLRPYAKKIVQHVTNRKDFSAGLLRAGYVESSVIYTKGL